MNTAQCDESNSVDHTVELSVNRISYTFRTTPFHLGCLPREDLESLARTLPKLARDRMFPRLAISGTANLKQLMKSCVNQIGDGRAVDLRNFLLTYGIIIDAELSNGMKLYFYDADRLQGILDGRVQLEPCREDALLSRANNLVLLHHVPQLSEEACEPVPRSGVTYALSEAESNELDVDEVVLALFESSHAKELRHEGSLYGKVREYTGSPVSELQSRYSGHSHSGIRRALQQAIRDTSLICLPSLEACTLCLVSLVPLCDPDMTEAIQECLHVFLDRTKRLRRECEQRQEERTVAFEADLKEKLDQIIEGRRDEIYAAIHEEMNVVSAKRDERLLALRKEYEQRMQALHEETRIMMTSLTDAYERQVVAELEAIQQSYATPHEEAKAKFASELAQETAQTIRQAEDAFHALRRFFGSVQ